LTDVHSVLASFLPSFPTRRSSDLLVHATHDRTVTVPLDVEFGEEITLLDPDARLGDSSVDDDPFAHGSTSPTPAPRGDGAFRGPDRKSTRLNSSHRTISYAVFCLK